MTCIPFKLGDTHGIICGFDPVYRFPLANGDRVYMAWHHYFGPAFYRDKLLTRFIDDWHENDQICDALDWFIKRGKLA